MTLRLPLVAVSGLALLVSACQLDKDQKPARPVVHYSLSSATTALGDDGGPLIPESAQAGIAGSLEMLFGTPQAPIYQLLPEWKDEGFNPNWPQYP